MESFGADVGAALAHRATVTDMDDFMSPRRFIKHTSMQRRCRPPKPTDINNAFSALRDAPEDVEGGVEAIHMEGIDGAGAHQAQAEQLAVTESADAVHSTGRGPGKLALAGRILFGVAVTVGVALLRARKS